MSTTEQDSLREGDQVHTYSSKRPYVWLWLLMLLLTAVAFAAVGFHVISFSILIPIILVLAAVQVFMQVFLFMHLPYERQSASRFFFLAGVSAAIIFIISTMIIVWSVG